MGYTKYEKARIIGARAFQLSLGAPFLVNFTEKEIQALDHNPIKLAAKEFDAGALPMTVRYKKIHGSN